MQTINLDHDQALVNLMAALPVSPYTPAERAILFDAMSIINGKGMAVAPLPRSVMDVLDPVAVRGVVETSADKGLITLFPQFIDMSLCVIKLDGGRGFFGRRYQYVSYVAMSSGEMRSVHTGKNLYKALFMVGAIFAAANNLAAEDALNPGEASG